MNINDVGYNVTIGEPVVDAKGVADSGLSFPCKAIPDGDYLVTLEVNGTVIAGRDKATFASGSATVGDYTLSYSSYAVSVATLTDDDVVVLRIEPLDVKVSDAFRAVVGKAAPAAGGGSGGGGVLVVKGALSDDFSAFTLDKTWQQIHDADAVVIYATADEEKQYYIIAWVGTMGNSISGNTEYIVRVYSPKDSETVNFVASSASGYPSYTIE